MTAGLPKGRSLASADGGGLFCRASGREVQKPMTLVTLLGLLRDRKGQGMVEYALIIALVAIVAAVALTNLGTAIATVFTGIISHL